MPIFDIIALMDEGRKIRIKVMGPMFGAFTKPAYVEDRYEFTYDAPCADYDWLVVFDELSGFDLV